MHRRYDTAARRREHDLGIVLVGKQGLAQHDPVTDLYLHPRFEPGVITTEHGHRANLVARFQQGLRFAGDGDIQSL